MAAALCTPPRVRKSIQNKRPLTDHKRVLFPTSSPDSLDENDQNLACSLSSSPSIYSPPLPSPTWSRTPRKSQTPQKEKSGDIFAQVAQKTDFNKLGSTSPYVLSPRRSPRVSNKSFKQCTNLDILNMLESPGKVGIFGNDKDISSDFITPKSGGSPNSRRSPRKSPTIKPNSFYGSSVGLLARNEANSVAGIKKIYRVPVTSKAKTKLFADSKPRTERKKNLHSDVVHKMKKRKEMFSGVCHSLKPVKPEKRKRSSSESSKQELLEKSLKAQQTGNGNKVKKDVRERINEALSVSKMTYVKQKTKKSPYPVVKFTKPDRMDVDCDSGSKRKIFKTSLKTPSRAYLESNFQSPVVTKKRKLLNPEEDMFNTSHLNSASDILDLIEDGKVIDAEEKKVKEGVDDLILQLDDELDLENVNNVMSAVNDKDFRDNVLNLSNLSIVDDADKLGSEESDVLTSPAKENAGRTPKKLFPVFEKRATQLLDLTNQSAETKQSNSANKKWHSIGENQYQIDAGQKRFGAKQCSTCGIVYQLGDPDDEIEHERYHRHFKTFKHTGWTNEKVVGQYGLDRVIMVKPENKAWWNKVLSILKVVDEELGYTTEDERVLSGLQVYLYVNKKHIAGCLVATQISHAYKMLISEPGIDICSEDSFPVKCGISRIWTHHMYRRQGIASRLVDTMRKTFFFGYCLKMDDFAFSAPTEDGKNFAKKYTGKPDYLIYTGW